MTRARKESSQLVPRWETHSPLISSAVTRQHLAYERRYDLKNRNTDLIFPADILTLTYITMYGVIISLSYESIHIIIFSQLSRNTHLRAITNQAKPRTASDLILDVL